jgi:hypothetical protein
MASIYLSVENLSKIKGEASEDALALYQAN